jgi:hypothetical protein
MKENEARSAKERVANNNNNNNGGADPLPLPPDDEGVLFRPRALAERKDPGLLEAVLKVMPADSMTQVYLRRGSRAGSLTSRRAATSSSLDNPAAGAALPRLSRGSQASLGTLSSARQPRSLSSPHSREGSQKMKNRMYCTMYTCYGCFLNISNCQIVGFSKNRKGTLFNSCQII